MVIRFIKQFDDFAENIANPPQDRPLAKAVGELGQGFCDALSARPGTLTPTFLQSPLKWACQPYWDSQGYDGPVEVPPFVGGQCPGSVYTAFIESIFNPDAPVGGSASLTGPISSLQIATEPSGNPSLPITYFLQWNDAGGPGRLSGFNSSAAAAANLSLTLFVTSGPDNCGNPEGVLGPGPSPAPDPGPLPTDVGPQINIRGNPIFVLPPTLEIAPNVSVDLSPGEFNFGDGAGGGPAEPPLPGDDAIGDGSGVGGGDNDFGDPPDGERWVGCCVTITGLPPGAGNIPQAEPESIYPRTIGNVRLKFRGSGALTEHDTPLVNRQKTTCVWEPVRGLQPTGVRVNLLPGYSYRYRPYSIPEEQ